MVATLARHGAGLFPAYRFSVERKLQGSSLMECRERWLRHPAVAP